MISILLIVAFGVVGPADDRPASLPDTDYAIAEGALFVAISGNDIQSGSRAAPLRTIATAVNRAPDGATIVIREGVYRETIGEINKRLILQPYPHENVWIRGSIEVTGWVPESQGWRKDDWQAKFEQNSYDPGEITADYALAGKPEMVFVDGKPLRQVGRQNALEPHTFYIDYDKHALYIGDDPRGKLIEATQFGHALELNRGATNSVIRGLGFAHYANIKHEGAVRMLDGVSNILLEYNAFTDNAGSSLLVYNCRNVTLRHNAFVRAGYQGLSAWKTDGLVIEENVFAFNNQKHFAIEGDFAGAAGAKIFASTDVTARKNEFAANYSTGLWFDGSCFACKVISNRFSNNKLAGVHVEESAQVMVVGNQAERNDGAGIYVSNSSDVGVYSNLLVDNGPNIAVQDDNRVNSNAEERARGITYITAGVHLFNNVLSIRRGNGPLLWVRDYNSVPRKSASEMIGDCDYNCWQHPENRNATLIEWWGKSTSSAFRDLESFSAETHCESHGFERQSDRDKFPAESVSGYPLPADVARELGRDSAIGPFGK